MHESSANLHYSSDNIVDEDEPISIHFLNQKFPNLQRAENLFRAYALNHGFAIKIQNTQIVSMIYLYMVECMFVI